MNFFKENLIPLLLTLTVMTGIFFILSYISYDIHSYRPEPVVLNNTIKGRIENNEFIANINTENLDEFYTKPKLIEIQPELPHSKFPTNDKDVYKWLDLKDTTK